VEAAADALLTPATRAELTFPGPVQRGAHGVAVGRVQEWLTLAGEGVAVDRAFGPATEAAVRRFQADHGRQPTGIVGQGTWDDLVDPLARACRRPEGAVPTILPLAVLTLAAQHLAEHPREVGGQNCGPWVRVYGRGREAIAWCAAFASFILAGACVLTGAPRPFDGSDSCDELARHAKAAGCFLDGIHDGVAHVRPGDLFLRRKTPGDWDHCGIVIAVGTEIFTTIEGNSDDSGGRDGTEVCRRTRGYADKDFLLIGHA